jgi:hypothetical protein
MLNGANTMRSLLALGLLMTLCASASAASGVRTHSAGHSINYGRYGNYGRYHGNYGWNYSGHGLNYGGLGRYYGSPNDRGGLVGGDDDGT